MRLALVTLLLFAGCAKEKRFTEPLRLHDQWTVDGDDVPDSGITLAPEQLTRGYEAYQQYCYACHGERGDGNGPSGRTMRPPPRNFVQGQFKFTGTGYGDLPSDAQLRRTIRRGLDGTPMLAWDLSEKELVDVIAYLKTLSPRWKEDGVKPELEISPDPWAGKDAEAIALGRRVYHVAIGGAGCSGCHASFEPRETLKALYKEASNEEPPELPTTLYEMGLKESVYPVLGKLAGRRKGCDVGLDAKPDLENLQLLLNGVAIDRDEKHTNGWDVADSAAGAGTPSGPVTHARKFAATLTFYGAACEQLKDGTPSLVAWRNHRLVPPSFLFHRVKTAPPLRDGYTASMQREDLYRVLGTGVGGAAMPGWKNVLEEEKLWALTYYVQSLMKLRGTPEAVERRVALEK